MDIMRSGAYVRARVFCAMLWLSIAGAATMVYLINRLREPSTRNAIAVGLTIAAQYLPMHAAWMLPLAGAIAAHTAATPDKASE